MGKAVNFYIDVAFEQIVNISSTESPMIKIFFSEDYFAIIDEKRRESLQLFKKIIHMTHVN